MKLFSATCKAALLQSSLLQWRPFSTSTHQDCSLLEGSSPLQSFGAISFQGSSVKVLLRYWRRYNSAKLALSSLVQSCSKLYKAITEFKSPLLWRPFSATTKWSSSLLQGLQGSGLRCNSEGSYLLQLSQALLRYKVVLYYKVLQLSQTVVCYKAAPLLGSSPLLHYNSLRLFSARRLFSTTRLQC